MVVCIVQEWHVSQLLHRQRQYCCPDQMRTGDGHEFLPEQEICFD